MAQNKYLDLVGLQEFKGLIDIELAKSFKSAKFDEATRILSLYKAETTDGTADFTVEIPETDISGLLEKLTTTNVGNIVITKVDGTIEDGGVALADLATKTEVNSVNEKVTENATAIDAINNTETGILAQAKDYTDEVVQELADGAVADNTEALKTLNGDETTEGSVAKAIKDASDAINATIGTVPEGQSIMGIIENIQENAYDDTELKGLIDDNTEAIEAHKAAIDNTVSTLVGEDTGKSVRTIANEELAAQLLSGEAEADFQTLQELAAWLEGHPEDVATINLNISNLQKLVGTLPEDATATDIVSYIAEAVAAEKTRAEGVESGLDERLQAVEEAVGEGGSVGSQIDAKIAELDADVTSAEVETGKGIQVQVVETDGKITAVNVAGNFNLSYDVAGSANSAEVNAKAYTDTEVKELADGQVKANQEAIEELQTKVGDGFESITSDEISALFA